MNALLAVQAYRQALEIDPDNALITDDDRFTIVCDNKYVISTYEDHLTTWIRNKWRKSTRGAIAHQVIWQEIDELRDEIGHLVEVGHKKGHNKKENGREHGGTPVTNAHLVCRSKLER